MAMEMSIADTQYAVSNPAVNCVREFDDGFALSLLADAMHVQNPNLVSYAWRAQRLFRTVH
jgi:hypothetical protein